MALTPNEKEMLLVLADEEYASAFTMAKRLMYSTEYAEILLMKLLGKGYIVREASERHWTYSVTEKGREEIGQMKTL